MMSALAMILMAGIAVGDVPKKNMAEVEKLLDLSGEWEGTFRNYPGARSKFRWSKGMMVVINDEMKEVMGVKSTFTDEGKGKIRWRIDDDEELQGIYRWEGDRILACFGKKQRPKDFQLTEERCLITLRRIKSSK